MLSAHLLNYIMVKSLANEIIQFLNDYSFKLYGIYNTYYDTKGNAIQSDFLFSKLANVK